MEAKVHRICLWDKKLDDFKDDPGIYIDRTDLRIGREYELRQEGEKKYKPGDQAELFVRTSLSGKKRVKVGLIELLNIRHIPKRVTVVRYKFKEVYDTL